MVSTKKHTDEMLDRYKKDGENYVLFEDLENNISITLKNYDYNEYDELKRLCDVHKSEGSDMLINIMEHYLFNIRFEKILKIKELLK